MAIYGSLAVMAVIVAIEDHPPTALRAAAQLFGVTLAIAVAKAYAEIIADTLDRGRRLDAEEWREILRKISPVLFGAQAPTLVFLMSAFGLFSVETAISISKVLVLGLLFVYGLRRAGPAQETLRPNPERTRDNVSRRRRSPHQLLISLTALRGSEKKRGYIYDRENKICRRGNFGKPGNQADEI
jgi:hypothetical protein